MLEDDDRFSPFPCVGSSSYPRMETRKNGSKTFCVSSERQRQRGMNEIVSKRVRSIYAEPSCMPRLTEYCMSLLITGAFVES